MKAADDNKISTSVNPANQVAQLHLSVSQVLQVKFCSTSGSPFLWQEIHPTALDKAAQLTVPRGTHPLAMYSVPNLSENVKKIYQHHSKIKYESSNICSTILFSKIRLQRLLPIIQWQLYAGEMALTSVIFEKLKLFILFFFTLSSIHLLPLRGSSILIRPAVQQFGYFTFSYAFSLCFLSFILQSK